MSVMEKKPRKKRAPMSEETRAKLSESARKAALTRTPEQEARRIAAMRAAPAYQNRHQNTDAYKSEECKAKRSAAHKRQWEEGLYADRAAKTAATRAAWSDEKRAEVSRKMSEAKKREWAEKGPQRNKPSVRRRVSNHERALIPYLEALGYQHNDSVDVEHRVIGRRVPDFIDRDGRRVFEYFGEFWHQDPDEDQRCIDYYRSKGWKCTILRERDLYDWLTEHRQLVTDEQHAAAWKAAQVNFAKLKKAG